MTHRLPGVESPTADAFGLSVLILALSLLPIVTGSCWGLRRQYPLPAAAIAHEGGVAYSVPVPGALSRVFHFVGDSVSRAQASSSAVRENGYPLGPSHSLHESIQRQGHGQFSHWDSTLYFSASDNSDPRSNGRSYTFLAFATVPIWVSCAWIAAFAAGLFAPSVTRSLSVQRLPMLAASAALLGFYAVVFGASRSVVTPVLGISAPVAVRYLWPFALLIGLLLAPLAGHSFGRLSPLFAYRWRSFQNSVQAFRQFEAVDRAARHLNSIESALWSDRWRGLLTKAIALSIPLAVYAIALQIEWPRTALFSSVSSVVTVSLVVGPVLYVCFKNDSFIGAVVAACLTVALFALPLLALWNHVAVHENAIGGLLPWSDAVDYFYDARRLIDGHLFGWSARRPLFPGLLAVFLAASGQNLEVALALFVVLSAIASVLLAIEMRAAHGPAAAVSTLLILFFFYRGPGGAGTTLTENLGFPLGVLSFTLLSRGARERRLGVTWLGLGLQTVALMARAGAFFVLPLLAITTTSIFERTRRAAVRTAVGSIVVIAAAAAIPIAAGRLLTAPTAQQAALSNFSYSLYGLVVGGKGWTQVIVDHPEAHEGAEMYALAFQAFKADPSALVTGIFKMWQEYLPGRPYHAFAFVSDVWQGPLVQWVCYVLTGVAIAICLVRRRQPIYMMLLGATIGHLASVPFAPPVDAGLRVYAATVPVLAMLVGIGAAELLRIIGRAAGSSADVIPETSAQKRVPWGSASAILGLATAATATLGPLTIYLLSTPPAVVERSCPAEQISLNVRHNPGTSLRVGADVQRDQRLVIPDVSFPELVRAGSGLKIDPDMREMFVAHTLLITYDIRSGAQVWLVAPTQDMPAPPRMLSVCGHRAHGMVFADSIVAGPER